MARSRYIQTVKEGRASYEDAQPRGTFGTASWWVRRSPVTLWRCWRRRRARRPAWDGRPGPEAGSTQLVDLELFAPKASPHDVDLLLVRVRRCLDQFEPIPQRRGDPGQVVSRRELRRGQTRHLGKRPGSACSARGRAPRGCRASWQVRHAAGGPERVGWSLDAMVSYSAERESSASTPGTILLPGT